MSQAGVLSNIMLFVLLITRSNRCEQVQLCAVVHASRPEYHRDVIQSARGEVDAVRTIPRRFQLRLQQAWRAVRQSWRTKRAPRAAARTRANLGRAAVNTGTIVGFVRRRGPRGIAMCDVLQNPLDSMRAQWAQHKPPLSYPPAIYAARARAESYLRSVNRLSFSLRMHIDRCWLPYVRTYKRMWTLRHLMRGPECICVHDYVDSSVDNKCLAKF